MNELLDQIDPAHDGLCSAAPGGRVCLAPATAHFALVIQGEHGAEVYTLLACDEHAELARSGPMPTDDEHPYDAVRCRGVEADAPVWAATEDGVPSYCVPQAEYAADLDAELAALTGAGNGDN